MVLTINICREAVFVRVWLTICCWIFEVMTNLRCIKWHSRIMSSWLWLSFLILKLQSSDSSVVTISNEHSQARVDVSRFSNSWDLTFSSLSHLRTIFRRTSFLLFLILFLITAYSWWFANSLTAVTSSFRVENVFKKFDDKSFMFDEMTDVRRWKEGFFFFIQSVAH